MLFLIQLHAKALEAAYLAVTNGRKAESVPLSRLRAELSDLDRKTVDDGLLRILQADDKARLGQISDPKALTQDERFRLGSLRSSFWTRQKFKGTAALKKKINLYLAPHFGAGAFFVRSYPWRYPEARRPRGQKP